MVESRVTFRLFGVGFATRLQPGVAGWMWVGGAHVTSDAPSARYLLGEERGAEHVPLGVAQSGSEGGGSQNKGARQVFKSTVAERRVLNDLYLGRFCLPALSA